MNEKISKTVKKRWGDPNFQQKMSIISSRTMTKLWKDPEYREKQSEERKKRWENPEYRERISKGVSKAQRKSFKDPDRYEKHCQMVKDTAPQRAKKMKNKWDDPDFIFRIMSARCNENVAFDTIEKRLGRKARLKYEREVNVK